MPEQKERSFLAQIGTRATFLDLCWLKYILSFQKDLLCGNAHTRLCEISSLVLAREEVTLHIWEILLIHRSPFTWFLLSPLRIYTWTWNGGLWTVYCNSFLGGPYTPSQTWLSKWEPCTFMFRARLGNSQQSLGPLHSQRFGIRWTQVISTPHLTRVECSVIPSRCKTDQQHQCVFWSHFFWALP